MTPLSILVFSRPLVFYPPTTPPVFGMPVEVPAPTHSQPVIQEPLLHIPGLQVRNLVGMQVSVVSLC